MPYEHLKDLPGDPIRKDQKAQCEILTSIHVHVCQIYSSGTRFFSPLPVLDRYVNLIDVHYYISRSWTIIMLQV